MSKIYILLVIAIIIGTLSGCDDMEAIHEEYLQGEKIYAGKLDSVAAYSGYYRVKIVGLTRYIGNSNECIVKWEDMEQSYPITNISDGKFDFFIENLDERSYEFELVTKDNEGNKSVVQFVTGKSIGDVFISLQSTRRLTGFELCGDEMCAIFSDKAESEYVISTLVSYETNDGQISTIVVPIDEASVPIPDFKSQGNITLISNIITGDEGGVDTVQLEPVDYQLPKVVKMISNSSNPIQASSSYNGDYAPNFAIDNDVNSRWATTSGDSPSWIMIDLEKEYEISSLEVYWAQVYSQAAYDFRIEVSNDGSTWTTAKEITENDGSNGKNKYEGLDISGRYLRIYITASDDIVSIFEMAVLGNDI